MKTETKYDYPTVGCYVDESAGSADDCNERTIDFAEGYGFKHEAIPDDDGEENDCECEESDRRQLLSELADDAVDFLNELETRPFMYWGFEDNSLFLFANVDDAKDGVGFTSSKDQDYPDDDYEGEWLHVSDHGNATLYVRENGKNREIWSVV